MQQTEAQHLRQILRVGSSCANNIAVGDWIFSFKATILKHRLDIGGDTTVDLLVSPNA